MSDLVLPGTRGPISRPTTALDVQRGFIEGYRVSTTVDALTRDLKYWFQWLADHDVDPLAAHRWHVDRWVNELIDNGLAPATLARMVSTVRRYYRWAVEQGVIDKSPVPSEGRDLHLPKVPSKSQTLGPDRTQATALYAAAKDRGERDHALVSLLLHQGLRASEACSLDRGHLANYSGHRTMRVHRKGGEDQTMALAPVAVAALERYLGTRSDTHAPLFLAGEAAKTYPRMNRQQVADVITGCCLECGFYDRVVDGRGRKGKRPWFTPHSLRHTCTTQLLDAGRTLRDVQVFMGHASPTTTVRYDLGRNQLDQSPAYTLSGWFS